jgi:type IV pilus assembly protein PilP
MMRASLVIALVSVALAGCGEQHSDLRQFVKDSDKLPRGRIPPPPEVKPYEPVAYNAFNLVDPFRPRQITPPKAVPGTGGLQPDLTRRKEPLEAYPLENLRMVGTLEQNKIMHALVRTPDNNLFRVRAGNYMGQDFGRITAISQDAIVLKEIVQDGAGNWEERDQALQLQEQETKK